MEQTATALKRNFSAVPLNLIYKIRLVYST